MSEIALTINGKQVKGTETDTILDVCRANSIDVPTLCHFKGLSDVGACRLCIVEVEKERRPVPSCTYPVRNGLVVQTHTEKLEKYRRQILELMFAERNHLCPYCVSSGDCELQNLAYTYQMDNIRYNLTWPAMAVDSLHKHLVIDHNRCILCGRCVRVCDEIACVHTLDFGNRGWKDMICADLNESIGQSSCISCGACFQACPTGAISAKSGTYRGRQEEFSKVTSACTICGSGCAITAMVKNNKVVRIDSPDLCSTTGLLCYKGRFEQIYDKPGRITKPLIRRNGTFETCSMDQAIDMITARLSEIRAQHGNDSIAGLATSQTSSEALKAFKGFMAYTIGTRLVDSLDGEAFRAIHQGITAFQNRAELDIEASSEEIFEADCLLIAGADPLTSHPVLGAAILKTYKKNKASIIVLDAQKNPFSFRTSLWLKPQEGKEDLTAKALTKLIIDNGFAKDSADAKKIAASLKSIDIAKVCKETGVDTASLTQAAEVLGRAQQCIIIYGEGIYKLRNPGLITSLLNLATIAWNRDEGTLKVLSLKPRGNSRGAWEAGIPDPQHPIFYNGNKNKVKAAYLLIADDEIDDTQLLENLKEADFVVAQASYLSLIAQRADVVLPSPIAIEREGSYTTLDGKAFSASRLVNPPGEIKQDHEIIQEIAKRFKAK